MRLVRDPKALSVSSSINLITDNYNIIAHHALGWFSSQCIVCSVTIIIIIIVHACQNETCTSPISYNRITVLRSTLKTV